MAITADMDKEIERRFRAAAWYLEPKDTTMYTAEMANHDGQEDLDNRIRAAVREQDGGYKAAYLRVYIDDPWLYQIEAELERRGFRDIRVPSIILKGDVYFSWRSPDEDEEE